MKSKEENLAEWEAELNAIRDRNMLLQKDPEQMTQEELKCVLEKDSDPDSYIKENFDAAQTFHTIGCVFEILSIVALGVMFYFIWVAFK